MEDKMILTLLLNRDQDAIPALKNHFGKRIYLTALNILGCVRDAQECLNDTLLALWNVIPPNQPHPLEGYAYRTGRNIALKRLRQDHARKRDSSYDVPLDELAYSLPGGDIWDTLNSRLLGQSINAFLSTQSRDTRAIFLRRYWYGDSVRSIAKAYSMKESAVSARLLRTREKLADHLKKEGFFDEA